MGEKKREDIGVNDPYKMREDLFNLLNNPLKVSANILSDDDVQIMKVDDGSEVIFIQIPEASYRQKPIYIKNNPGLAFERLGEGDRKLTMEKLSISLKDEFILNENTKTRLPFKSDLITSAREALVNSLMHAYYASDVPIKITSYPDYIEFVNPGKMRITVDEFIHGGTSNIMNHTMSTIMRRIGISEKAGSGGPRIFDIASKYKLKLPEIVREQDYTSVRIWKVDLEETFKDYSESQQKILYYLIEHHSISRGEAIGNMNMAPYHFRVTMSELLEMNLVEMVGKGPSTKYLLKPSLPEQSYSLKRLLKFLEDRIVSID